MPGGWDGQGRPTGCHSPSVTTPRQHVRDHAARAWVIGGLGAPLGGQSIPLGSQEHPGGQSTLGCWEHPGGRSFLRRLADPPWVGAGQWDAAARPCPRVWVGYGVSRSTPGHGVLGVSRMLLGRRLSRGAWIHVGWGQDGE